MRIQGLYSQQVQWQIPHNALCTVFFQESEANIYNELKSKYVDTQGLSWFQQNMYAALMYCV